MVMARLLVASPPTVVGQSMDVNTAVPAPPGRSRSVSPQVAMAATRVGGWFLPFVNCTVYLQLLYSARMAPCFNPQ